MVLLDRADRKLADNLDRLLRNAGRRSLVVASVAPGIDPPTRRYRRRVREEEASRGAEISLDYALTDHEIQRFRTYLEKNYGEIDADLLLRLLSSDPAVFALLYRLIPDTRENIRAVLVDEYLELIEGLSSFHPPGEQGVRGSSLGDQLRIWLAHQKPNIEAREANTAQLHTGLWHKIATHLPQLVLLFASLDEAISLNLLTKRFPGLLQVYTPLRKTLENSGFFVEVALDKESDIGLTAVNPFVAQLLLNAAVPSSVARIQLLATLLYEFPWDPEARPADAPEQALLIHLIRSIAPPNGAFHADYQRTEDLKTLAEVLKQLREDFRASLPQLLLIEGILWRHVGRRIGDDTRINDALQFYRLSRSVLETARDILARRRPSPSRNFELSMVLNAIATTIGHTFNAESRARTVDDAGRKELVQKALDTASESRAYTEAYHPLDTAFWTNRDFYNYLIERPDTEENRSEREQAILNMADALDKAGELGELPHDQANRLQTRVVELTTYLNDLVGAQKIAEVDAESGRFGWGMLAGSDGGDR